MVDEPYSATSARKGIVVDVYVHPTIDGMVYLDSRILLGHSVSAVFEGIEIPVLEDYVEAVLAAAHAVYKERIYTLNGYVTVARWLDRRSLELAHRLGIERAVELAYCVNRAVGEVVLTLPYKLPLALWLETLLAKTLKSKMSRTTLPNILKALGSRRAGRQMLSKIVRKTY